MSDPFKRLKSKLDSKMQRQISSETSGKFGELGTVTATGIKLDNFKHEIKDYLIADYLTLPNDFMTAVEPGKGEHDLPSHDYAHDHNVVTPKQLKPLKPGDRVLVIPVAGGQEFVIIARVVVPGA